MKIQYYTRDVYGNQLAYPVSIDAQLVCSLTGRKTLSTDDLRKLKEYGASVERVLQPE